MKYLEINLSFFYNQPIKYFMKIRGESYMRIWCKLYSNNHLLKDTVIECYDMSMSRTQKVYYSLEQACYELDLEKPMWLEKNKREFIRNARTSFSQDNFIEEIEFDHLDFHVIEEDW